MLDLDPILEPNFVFKYKGKEVAVSAWDTLAKVQPAGIEKGTVMISEHFDAVRKAFNLPEITPQQCMALADALMDFIDGLDVSKKAQARLVKSSVSMA